MWKRTTSVAALFVMGAAVCVVADDYAESTLTEVGDSAPPFELTLLDETAITSADLQGNVVLLNFFATWCGPCVAEMPHLQEVSERFEGEPFTLIAVGREHNADELTPFRDEHGLTFPLAPDPQREVYAKFATQYIPRNVVVNAEGTIIYQAVGYDAEQFEQLIEVIEQAVAAVEESEDSDSSEEG